MSRRAHKPTADSTRTVETMAGFGVPHEEIAKVLQIDAKTLRKHYRLSLDTAHTKANSRVAQTLFKQAVDGNVSAAIFWMKARAGWREKVEHTGDEGGPIKFTFNIDNAGDR